MANNMLKIISFELGPVLTNTYLVADTVNGQAVVIDPAWDGAEIVEEANRNGWQISQIWITHAHFDHIAGTKGVIDRVVPPPTVALHPKDLPLWRMQGGAPMFGMHIDPGPEPDLELTQGQVLFVGRYEFEVRFTPGHTSGHVVFYCPQDSVMFCGDVIFQGSIGRTDLPGGDYSLLLESIRSQILTLPDDVRLYSGHGPSTTVGDERRKNPYLN